MNVNTLIHYIHIFAFTSNWIWQHLPSLALSLHAVCICVNSLKADCMCRANFMCQVRTLHSHTQTHRCTHTHRCRCRCRAAPTLAELHKNCTFALMSNLLHSANATRMKCCLAALHVNAAQLTELPLSLPPSPPAGKVPPDEHLMRFKTTCDLIRFGAKFVD